MGLALAWKPAGLGSQEYLAFFKREVLRLPGPARQGIGHNGTLDPFAEGLLLIGWDEGTKLISGLTGLSKSYRAEVLLGHSSDTLDATAGTNPWPNLDVTALAERARSIDLTAFVASKIGRGRQRPPQFSAIKIDGRRSYELARKGKGSDLPERDFEILAAKHLGLEARSDAVVWRFEVEVTAGTYIRALARDWSLELFGEPALLSGLVRTGIGPFVAETNQDLPRHLKHADLCPVLFRALTVDADRADRLRRHGQWQSTNEALNPDSKYLISDPHGDTIAWASGVDGGRLQRVFLSDPLA